MNVDDVKILDALQPRFKERPWKESSQTSSRREKFDPHALTIFSLTSPSTIPWTNTRGKKSDIATDSGLATGQEISGPSYTPRADVRAIEASDV